MPLTPAHAAAAWPLRRALRRLPLDALVIGTTAPDLEYILRLRPQGRFGHTPLGILVFCLPAGLLVWLGWRRLVRPALVTLLPKQVASSLHPPRGGLAQVVTAILLGAVSHVVWDGCTHYNGWAVRHLPALRLSPASLHLPWFTLLQHASTLLGLAVVIIWVGRAIRRIPPPAWRYDALGARRATRVALALLTATAAGVLLNGARGAVRGPAWALGYGFVGGTAALLLALTLLGLIARRSERTISSLR